MNETISLTKGQRISLTKGDGNALNQICVGVNWGAIESKGFLGQKKVTAVDLDASVAVFDENGETVDIIYFNNKKGKGIKHSGDDLEGDIGGDDGSDNEVISIDLSKVDSRARHLAILLNSYRLQDFKDIPFASARIYEGSPNHPTKVHAKYNIAKDEQFAGSFCIIVGSFYKHNDTWKFQAIGKATPDHNIDEMVRRFKKEYIN